MTDAKTPFHNPFGALSHLRGTLPKVPSAPPVTPGSSGRDAALPSAPPGKGPARAVVRIERSGRGGKEVTVVEHLDLRPADRETWLKALKASLGCGGTIEEDALVLQGDQRDRLPKILTARGVRKITLG